MPAKKSRTNAKANGAAVVKVKKADAQLVGEVIDLTAFREKSRAEQLDVLMEASLCLIAIRLASGDLSAGVFKELLSLCRAAGVDLGVAGQATSAAGQSILDSLDDLDPDLFT